MKKIKIGTFLSFLILSSLCQAASSIDGLQEQPPTSRYSILNVFGDFSLLFSTPVSAEEMKSDNIPKYSAIQIIEDIKDSTTQSYLKDHLLIKNPLFSKLKEGDEDIVEKFKTVINKINKNIGKKTKFSQSGRIIQYYPEENAVDSYLSAGE